MSLPPKTFPDHTGKITPYPAIRYSSMSFFFPVTLPLSEPLVVLFLCLLSMPVLFRLMARHNTFIDCK